MKTKEYDGYGKPKNMMDMEKLVNVKDSLVLKDYIKKIRKWFINRESRWTKKGIECLP